MIEPTQAQIEAVRDLLPGYEQYLEMCRERGVLFLKNGQDTLDKAKSAIAALSAAADVRERQEHCLGAFANPPAAAQVGDDTRFAVDQAMSAFHKKNLEVQIATTIERCAQVADKYANFDWDPHEIAAEIRALKTETGP